MQKASRAVSPMYPLVKETEFMPLSLYDATVPSYLQILNAVAGLIDKADAYCDEGGHDPATVCGACLAEDMKPFAYQILSTWTHSIGAIEGVRAGSFSPNMATPPASFAEQRALVADARARLEQVTTEEMEGFFGKPLVFSIPGTKFVRHFVAEQFLLSFSQPNFYFHATTAYDILRHNGVKIGKIDYLGAFRTVEAP